MDVQERQELNERLLKLILEAQSHPPKSRDRNSALTKIVTILKRPGLICRPNQGQFPHTYEDIYDDARSKLWFYICDNIDTYRPESSQPLTWINFFMINRCFNEAIRTILGKPELNSNRTILGKPELNSNFDEIDKLSQPELQPCLSEILREYIEEDPENLLKSRHIRDRPDVNFQVLLLYRLDGIKWQKISTIFGISASALSDFYQRHLKQFAPIFKQYLQK